MGARAILFCNIQESESPYPSVIAVTRHGGIEVYPQMTSSRRCSGTEPLLRGVQNSQRTEGFVVMHLETKNPQTIIVKSMCFSFKCSKVFCRRCGTFKTSVKISI